MFLGSHKGHTFANFQIFQRIQKVRHKSSLTEFARGGEVKDTHRHQTQLQCRPLAEMLNGQMYNPSNLPLLTFKGIRGIASLFIVTSHSLEAYIPNYLWAADEDGATPHLFQLPYFRVVATGRFWTAIFFLLSGYVCAVK